MENRLSVIHNWPRDHLMPELAVALDKRASRDACRGTWLCQMMEHASIVAQIFDSYL